MLDNMNSGRRAKWRMMIALAIAAFVLLTRLGLTGAGATGSDLANCIQMDLSPQAVCGTDDTGVHVRIRNNCDRPARVAWSFEKVSGEWQLDSSQELRPGEELDDASCNSDGQLRLRACEIGQFPCETGGQ
jgi:hypothetical protein